MKSNTIKAVRATISLGSIELDCLQFPDGTYHFFINQLNDVLRIKASDSTGKKHLQPLIEASPKQVNQASVEGIKSTVKTLSLGIVSQAIGIYAQLGNEICKNVAFACVAESLERRADTAFGIDRTEQERNDRMKARQKGIVARRTLTDAIADYLDRHPDLSDNYRKFVWSNCSDHLNLIILGAKSKQAREFLEVPKNSLLRNHIPVAALDELERVEDLAGRVIDNKDTEPLEAVKYASLTMFTKSIGMD